MEEIIKSTHDVLKYSNRFGWDARCTDNLLTIFEFASQHELQLSLLPFGDMSDQFRLTAIDSTAEQLANAYFRPDQFSCIAAILTVLSEAELIESSDLNARVDQLEKRIAALEGKPQSTDCPEDKPRDTDCPISEAESQGADDLTLEEKVEALNKRAEKINNYVYLDNGRIIYVRYRRKHPNGQRWQVYFTIDDVYQPERKHRYSKWYFGKDELDALKRTLQHDEELYRQANAES